MPKLDEIFKCLTEGGYGYDKMSAMNQIKTQLFLLFMGICTSRYKWQGLPKEMPSWCVEKILNFYGQGVVFKQNDEYLITSTVNSADLNIYGEPCEVQPVAINGMTFDRQCVKDTVLKVGDEYQTKPQTAVLIKNNMYSIPTYFLIKPYIERLCFIWESAGINAGLSRIVALVHCNKDVSSTVRAEINKIMGGTKSGVAIVGEKTNILEQIEKVDLKVDYKPDLYWQDFDNTFNMLCQSIGLTTDMNKSKKERVVVAQVESNDEVTTVIESSFLEFRKLGCEELKELFGLDVTVDNRKEEVKPTSPTDDKPKPEKEVK